MVRVSRMVIAEKASPRIRAGIAIWPRLVSGFSRKDVNFTSGDQPHQIEGKTMISVPIQKPGTASARIAKERVT